MDFICPGCKEEFTTQFPFGDSVTCPHCGRTWETDWEEDWDNMWAWILDVEVKND